MDDHKQSVARACLAGAEAGAMTFPQIVGALMQEGFEGYAIDFRRAVATYYLPDGDSVEAAAHDIGAPIAATLDAARVQAAVREAQQLSPGYTYRGFCEKIAVAGCAGYFVSFSGRRVLYIGRTAETYTEPFPD